MKNPLIRIIPLLILLTVLGAVAFDQPGDSLRGFSPSNSRQQRELEARFLAVPDAASAEKHHRILTAEPHVAGSEADRRTAEYVLGQFRSYGLDAEIEEFHVLLSEPRKISLELLGPKRFRGPSPEFVKQDPASKDKRTLPGFNAYSASGDVTAEIVYAHYGLPSDYDRLREEGVEAAGKIILARYGRSFRGVKARVAEENGAVGLIIYSDPRDDGYHAGETYPDGPYRPASGVQRGSVLYIFNYPGDPTTPDGPSLEGAPRITYEEADNVPRIPVLPLSHADARHFLEAVSGPVAPREWQGGLPFTYHLGPGPARARLQVEMTHEVKPVWIVVAKIKGTEQPNQVVILGNHRDAWTYGGVDPNSGTASMLEVARGLGELLAEGWRPRRSLWLCSWDAEEQGLLGSTEWTEKHAGELSDNAVAYLNLDVSVAGDRFGGSAVPSLKKFFREVIADVPDPQGGSVLERANRLHREEVARTVVPGNAVPGETPPQAIAEREISFGNLGSGSDYTSFLDHLGIASTDFSFGGRYGVYHSIFDNHRWMKEWGDPEFAYHVAAARIYGLQALRLAQADLLPFDYETYGKEIEGYLNGIRNKAALMGVSHELDFEAAGDAAHRLSEAGRELQERYQWALAQGMTVERLDEVNQALVLTERALLLPEGLPGRPWFRHAIFAPGTYTGYASVPLPGVHESLDAGNLEEAQRQLDLLTDLLGRATELLSQFR